MPATRLILGTGLTALMLAAGGLALAWGVGGEECVAAPGGGPECLGASLFVPAKTASIPVGPMAGRPAIGDVNGDGRADIVVACGTCCGSRPSEESGHIVVLLGDGQGGFNRAAGSPIKVAPSIRKLALGDINGDDTLDIVAAEHDSHDLTIFLGDGSGRFVRRVGGAVSVMNGPIRNPADGSMGVPPPHTHEVALADVNNDGRLDILATSVSAHGVAVLLNQSDGSFVHAPGSPQRVRAPYDALATADMNGDGHTDILAPSIAGGAVNLLLGDGTGAFAPAEGSPFKVGERPGYVAVGDCNGDGTPDVFVTHDDVPMVTILANDGAGRLAPAAGPPVKLKLNGFLWGVVSGDFNRDGRLDLACGNAAGRDIVVLLGDGRGGFAGGEARLTAGDGAGYVVAGDLNGDGRADLVTGNYQSGDVSILLAVERK